MRIGIDISQIVYEGTGVATYVRNIVRSLLAHDKNNTYILFGSSFRKKFIFDEYFNEINKINKNVSLVSVAIPPTLLDILWNKLHIMPIEKLIGPVDVFWSSDWTQPPLGRARGVTTIHDLIALKFPDETDKKIVATHKRRLAWVKKECTAIFCDSQSTKKDVMELLHISENKLYVVYPGL